MVAKQLTVVQVVPEMDEGGVEGETLDFAIYLAREGHRSVVISGGGRLVRQLEQNGVNHVYWKDIGTKSARCLKYISRLRAFLIDQRVDVLHLRSRLPAWIGYFAWRGMNRSTRPALVTSFHGFYSVNAYSTIMTRGERVIAVSDTIREHILSNYQLDPQRIELIYGGYDPAVFDPDSVSAQRVAELKKSWGIDRHDGPVIMLPGRITSWKGQDVFVEALAKIKELPFCALCVGDTDENQSFTKRLRDSIENYGLEDKVRLVGHCDDMPAALLASDLVVSASSSQPEAFGKVAIEAMAMGRPVIATRHGGSLETVRENMTGWFVEPADADDLAACLRRVLTAKEILAETGARGQQWVQNHFTARCMCEKTIDCYRRLLEEKRKRRTGEILSVVQMLPELDSGGVERGTLEIGRYLADRQHRSFVISGGGRLVEQLETEGSRHVYWQVGAKSPLTLKYVLPLRRLLKNEQIDILHLRSRMPAWIGYIAWKSLPKKYRPTLVTTFHGFYSVNRYSAIMTKGEGIIAISKSIERHIREAYGVRHGIKLIFRGVDKEIFDPAAIDPSRIEQLRTAWNIDGTKPLIILPGRLTRLKGQDVFIRALAQMGNTDYQALLIGDIKDNPKFTEELMALIGEYKLADCLSLVGYCDDMPAALMLADIVVSASSNEPEAFGRTTIEAMAMGKAVVATAHGGSLETVTPGQTGWLVRPGDAADLARALDEALQSAERRAAFGRAGRELVNRTFTMKQMCEETEALYRELVDAKRRTRTRRVEVQEAELN